MNVIARSMGVAALILTGFAVVSGDRNPIHVDQLAARLAGLGEPIVHGMWLSAAARAPAGSGTRRPG